jgi:anti-anti-sigma factor
LGLRPAGGQGAKHGLTWALEIVEDEVDGIAVVSLAGRLGRDAADRLAAALDATIDRSPRLVLDLERVDYASSPGLQAIEAAAARCASAKGALVLAAAAEPVRIALELSGLLLRLPLEPSREQALVRVRTGG